MMLRMGTWARLLPIKSKIRNLSLTGTVTDVLVLITKGKFLLMNTYIYTSAPVSLNGGRI